MAEKTEGTNKDLVEAGVEASAKTAENREREAKALETMNINMGIGLEKELQKLEVEQKRLQNLADELSLQENRLRQEQLILRQINLTSEKLQENKAFGGESLKQLTAQILALKKINPQLGQQLDLIKQRNTIEDENGQKVLKLSEMQLKKFKEISLEAERERGLAEDAADFTQKAFSFQSKIADTMGITAKYSQTNTGYIHEMIKDITAGRADEKFQSMATALSDMLHPANIFSNLLDSALATLKEQVLELDKLAKQFQSTTGFVGDFESEMHAVFQATVRSGVSLADTNNALSGLSSNISSFNPKSIQMRNITMQNVVMLEKFGLSIDNSTKMIDFFERAIGKTRLQAVELTRNITTAGRDIGISSSKMATDFTSNMGKIMRFGNQAISVFQQMAAQSKATGIAMNSLIDVASKFDTFDGATKKVASLNAVLGTNLSALEMMNMDYAERINYLRQELSFIGENMSALDPYTQQYVQNALEVSNVEEAQRLLNMSTAEFASYNDDLKDKEMLQKELAIATEGLVPVMQQLQLAWVSFITNEAVVGVLKSFSSVIKTIADNIGTAIAGMLVLGGVLSALTTKYLISTKLVVADTLAKVANAGQTIANAAAIINEAGAVEINSAAKKKAAFVDIASKQKQAVAAQGLFASLGRGLAGLTVGAAGAVVLLKVSAAVFLIAAGLGLMAAGMAFLVRESAGAGDALWNVVGAMLAMTVAVAGLVGVASLASAAAPVLGVLAGVIVAASVGMAILGLSLDGLAENMEKIGNGALNLKSGLSSLVSVATQVKTAIGSDGILMASVEGGRTSVVMSGDQGILKSFTSDKLVVDVKIPEINIPTPNVYVYLDGTDLSTAIYDVVLEMGK